MVEENETPGDDSPAGSQPGGLGSEGRARRGEGDLLAERRARRAAESGEHALTLRAEAAEATVRTLETHVSSLQQRLRDAEEQSRRAAEMIEADRAARSGGLEPRAPERPGRRAGSEDVVERELRQVKQREYAEQRLRVEAEDQLIDLERESRAEVDRLSRRLGDSELEANKLAARLEGVQRELAEAEQAAGAERSAVRRDEQILHARVTDLERRALEIQHSLEAERAARERAERLLESMRRGHRAVEALVAELKDVVARLKAVAANPPPAEPPVAPVAPPPPPAPPVAPLARATTPAQAPPAPQATTPAELPSAPQAPGGDEASASPSGLPHAENGEMVDALAAAVERLRARVAEQAELTSASASKPPKHKHSQSLITRLRIARKQRRAR
jgi:peptidoglycan DL-endopeptidase CwlO